MMLISSHSLHRYPSCILGVLSILFLVCMAMDTHAEDIEGKRDKNVPLESLFYTKKEVRRVKEAYLSYLNKDINKKSGSDFSASEYYDKAAEIKKLRSESRYFTYPQFFLESLVFHSDIDWSIWVSGQKIIAEHPAIEDEIRVTGIDKDGVSFEWSPYDMDKVKEVWEASPNDMVVVNIREGTVNFTLLPNQTFSSFVMRVLEGKLLPVIIDRKDLEDELQSPIDILLPAEDEEDLEVINDDLLLEENTPILDKPLEKRSLSKEFIGLFGN